MCARVTVSVGECVCVCVSDGVNACMYLTEGESLEERKKVEERRQEGREREGDGEESE